jgi:phycobilisome rod-core linker protein
VAAVRNSSATDSYLAWLVSPPAISLPLLNTPRLSQNALVKDFMIGNEETPRQALQTTGLNTTSVDDLIEQAYRQIYFHAFKVDRDPTLETRLRDGRISVREFVRALLVSDKFRNDFYRCNSNYRVVEQIVGRALGRKVHGEQERIALSILLAQKGLPGLVDHLLNSEEYQANFGEDVVPFQRNRVLAGRSVGTMPFNQQAPRYDRYWRETTNRRAPSGRGTAWAPSSGFSMARPAWLADAPSPLARKIWQGVVTTAGFGITGLVIYTAGCMLSIR